MVPPANNKTKSGGSKSNNKDESDEEPAIIIVSKDDNNNILIIDNNGSEEDRPHNIIEKQTFGGCGSTTSAANNSINIGQVVDDDDNNEFSNIIDVEEEEEKLPETYNKNNNNTDDDDDIPTIIIITKFDVFWDFNGSIGFVIGSSGFILTLYHPLNWLPYFRYGCIIWIWGCISYSIPIFMKHFNYYKPSTHEQKNGTTTTTSGSSSYYCSFFCCCCCWSLGDVGCLLCMSLFIVGCILGAFFDENQVIEYIIPISYLFCLGSFALTIEPLYQAFRVCRDYYYYLNKNKSDNDFPLDSTNNNHRQGGSRRGCFKMLQLMSLDRVLELLGTTSFCVAGIFSGFGRSNMALTVGMYYWGIGSMFCFGRSCLMWYNMRQQQQSSSMLVTDDQRQVTAKNETAKDSIMELVVP